MFEELELAKNTDALVDFAAVACEYAHFHYKLFLQIFLFYVSAKTDAVVHLRLECGWVLEPRLVRG